MSSVHKSTCSLCFFFFLKGHVLMVNKNDVILFIFYDLSYSMILWAYMCVIRKKQSRSINAIHFGLIVMRLISINEIKFTVTWIPREPYFLPNLLLIKLPSSAVRMVPPFMTYIAPSTSLHGYFLHCRNSGSILLNAGLILPAPGIPLAKSGLIG